MILVGESSWQESDQSDNLDRRSKFLEISGYKPRFAPNKLNLIALLLKIINIVILPHGR